MFLWRWIKAILCWFRGLKKGNKIVAIDSNYEPVTKAAYEFRQEYVYPKFTIQNYKIIRNQGISANRTSVKDNLMCYKDIKYITGVGHGNYNLYTGHRGNIVFKIGDYLTKEVKGRVIHLLSCRTARDLGPDFVEKGCLAFFGYTENFTFYWGYEEIFFRCDSEIDVAFASGSNAKKVYENTKKIYEDAIDELNDGGHYYIAAILQEDLDILKCPSIGSEWGNETAII